MYPTNPRRLKELRYIRMRSIGASARAAAAHAGWHPNSSTPIERRLKPEVEFRKAQLAGNGKTTWTISKRDVHRVLWYELARIADRFGPNQKAFEEQALRSLASQVKLGDARDHHGRINTKLSREAKTGGPLVRTLKMRELCRQLIIEIAKLKGAEAAGEDLASGRKAPVVTGRGFLETGTPVREGAREAAWCPRHPSQPLNRCQWCNFTQAAGPAVPERWGDDW